MISEASVHCVYTYFALGIQCHGLLTDMVLRPFTAAALTVAILDDWGMSSLHASLVI
jgi:hypothetical protein